VSYTFGAATTDKIAGSTAFGFGANSSAFLIAGWWYPTTLTSGRGYFGMAGGNTFIGVGTTTSEIRLLNDRTVDSVRQTSGAGIVINQWHFIAVVASLSSGGTPAYRVWVGLNGASPVEVTVSSVTAGSGSGVNSAGKTIGNTGTAGSASWQGRIGQVTWMQKATAQPLTLFPFATAGTITQPEADRIFSTIVLPLYRGQVPTHLITPSAYATSSVIIVVEDLEALSVIETIRSQVATFLTEGHPLTVTGASAGADRQPGQMIGPDWAIRAAPFCRR